MGRVSGDCCFCASGLCRLPHPAAASVVLPRHVSIRLHNFSQLLFLSRGIPVDRILLIFRGAYRPFCDSSRAIVSALFALLGFESRIVAFQPRSSLFVLSVAGDFLSGDSLGIFISPLLF